MVLPDAHTQRPHYNGHVAAGAWDIEPQPIITDTWRDILDIAPEYDFTATATGDSMLPLIHDGDTLYCRRLYRGDPLCPRSVYLFSTPSGTLVKQLHLPVDRETTYSADIDTLTLRSLNPAYADIDVPSSDIAGIAKVVATFHPLADDISDPAPGLRPGSPADAAATDPTAAADPTATAATAKKPNTNNNQ